MESLQGQLLIATPGLMDPNFFRTVVLIVEHTEEGAMGLVLNRPMGLSVEQVWEDVGEGEGDCGVSGAVRQGGPCEGPVMIVHPFESASQIDVCPGVYFSTESYRVSWVIEKADSPTLVFLGYSGWGAGQLESELDCGGWLTMPADEALVFSGLDAEALWKRAMHQASRSRIDVDAKIFPDDPSMN